MKRTTSLSLMMFCLLGMTACSSVETGRPINYSMMERFTLGISTQENVKLTLGHPQAVVYVDDRTVYQYRFLKKTYNTKYIQAVDLVFNKQQRLIDITINDGQNDMLE
ncbi:hypothetical protein [Vibrio anguillarum]|uniref:Lipoprotein SmpA/OmlA domain-containing protein n=1 Tax=Vibrio anguillarum TaxID=55601 RepID=A0AAW4BP92_VIBAN|nr:hypothetical protein [Vibrio anguillarum]MBF4374354.1 hypothetical protein [Vibrio anguillarum]MBF4438488.1 hypothetical protein [Vibrio anguillarum]